MGREVGAPDNVSAVVITGVGVATGAVVITGSEVTAAGAVTTGFDVIAAAASVASGICVGTEVDSIAPAYDKGTFSVSFFYEIKALAVTNPKIVNRSSSMDEI